VESKPIGPVLDRLKEALSFMGTPKTKQRTDNNVLIYRYGTTFPPEVPMRLKIEINCKEHFSVQERVNIPFNIRNQWFSGSCNFLTYTLDELIGTKIRALYQRKKGRDLFDLYYALKSGRLDVQNAIMCYRKYIAFSGNKIPSAMMYSANLAGKINDSAFREDIVPILTPGTDYDIDEAFELVKEQIIDAM